MKIKSTINLTERVVIPDPLPEYLVAVDYVQGYVILQNEDEKLYYCKTGEENVVIGGMFTNPDIKSIDDLEPELRNEIQQRLKNI